MYDKPKYTVTIMAVEWKKKHERNISKIEDWFNTSRFGNSDITVW